ncbi:MULTISPECIES: D-alanyl-D-alanine carboxypeptidase [unclassified Microbacterium]|uniref:D-alanyl-D-alanine carboxypeptidase family protein n=1 Tax=unclassified Microbacterium TaxID=2609290 RepID=UPI001AD1191C|nr:MULTISPECIES: D-alanyl-D-alanine carboxypeptidase [unclassified Microbacterium]MBN9215687.1 D-alanyl-D-alanine carboxypeptidase [Microbacterium sp.]
MDGSDGLGDLTALIGGNDRESDDRESNDRESDDRASDDHATAGRASAVAAAGTAEQPLDDTPPTAAPRRRAWIGGTIAAAIVLLLGGGTAGYIAWALNAPLPTPVATTRELTAPDPGPAVAIAMPSEGAAAIAITGGENYLGPDGIHLAVGASVPRPIASISKLITALVILDAHPLASADDPGPTITFSKADHDLYDEYYVQDAIVAAMPTGSTMSLHDALATMLIPSASNYAEAVSTWAFGSQGAFLAAVRDWTAREGLSGTTLVEPTGISPRNVSTTADLLRIADLASANPTLAQIAATPSITLAVPGTLTNTNSLLGVDGITGLKTGNLGEGTFSLVYTSTFDVGIGTPLSVTGVSLDGFTRSSVDAGVTRLLDSVRDGFHFIPVATAGTVVGVYETAWGSSAQLVLDDGASILTWSDTPVTVEMETTAPVTYADGEQVGTATWTAGPNSVSVPVRISGTITPPGDWWRLTNPSLLG